MIRDKLARLRRPLVVVAALAVTTGLFATPASAARGLHLVFVQGPTAITAGQPVTPSVTVVLLDRSDQPVTNKPYPVTMSIASGTAAGKLWGTTTRSTNAAGVATFDDLTVDLAGTYTLLATNADASSATSGAFGVTGLTIQCRVSPCQLKTGSSSQSSPTNGFATLSVVSCDATQCPFLSQDVVSPAQCGPQACLNNQGMAVFPPSNSSSVVTFVLENYFTPSSGGIGNRPTYLVKADGTVIELAKCPSRPGNRACVLKDSSSNGSIVRTTVQFPANDPIIQK